MNLEAKYLYFLIILLHRITVYISQSIEKGSYFQMVNYNMGRYYAWSNLRNLLRSKLSALRPAPTYSYKYIPPQAMRAKIVPYQQWKGRRQRIESEYNVVLLSALFLTAALARFAYQVLFDDYLGYFYQVNYPVASRSIELIYADLVEYSNPFLEIMPKNRYEVPQILPKLYELFVQKQKKIEKHDKKVFELRKEIEQYDKKHK